MTVANYTLAPAATSAPQEFRIASELAGLRLDQALARLMPEHSRSRIRAWIDAGGVTIADAPAAANIGYRRRVASPLPSLRADQASRATAPLSVVRG
jgi:23S rRNA pseudouridine1911/1915/1917 synthase